MDWAESAGLHRRSAAFFSFDKKLNVFTMEKHAIVIGLGIVTIVKIDDSSL